MMMRPSVRTDMSVMNRPRNSADDLTASDRLRSRLSGSGSGTMVPIASGNQQVSRRRRSSVGNDSEVSQNTNVASAGGSPPRVTKNAFAPRRPKVSFPTSQSSSALQTLARRSTSPTQTNQELRKPARISLRPALKQSPSHSSGQHSQQQRPPVPPPPPSDVASAPSSVASLTDSETMPSRRPQALSFRPPQKVERPQLPPPPQSAGRLTFSMPGAWDDLDESVNPREEHNEIIRRRPATHHHSLPSSPRQGPREIEYIPEPRRHSESEFSDSDLSENTEVTTAESDITVSYTKPARKTRVHLLSGGNNTDRRDRDSDKRALAPLPPQPARRHHSGSDSRPTSPTSRTLERYNRPTSPTARTMDRYSRPTSPTSRTLDRYSRPTSPTSRTMERYGRDKPAMPSAPRPAPPPREESGRRTVHIEVITPPAPAKESPEQIKKREEEVQRRQRIEADLLGKIADLERQLQQEAESKMALIRARTPSPTKRSREAEVAAAAAAAAEAEALASKEQLSGALERLSVMQAREAEAQASRDQLSGVLERLSVMQAQREAEMAEREAEARASKEQLSGALERLSVMQAQREAEMAERERQENDMQALVLARDQERSRGDELARRSEEMQYQIERQAKDLADVRETLLEQSKALEDRCSMLAQAEKERDEARNSKIEAEARIGLLEQEVNDVRAAKSQSEIVTIERLAASELVREVLQIKVSGFEAEVKNKAMEIEDLTKARNELDLELAKTKADVITLTAERTALQLARADAEKKIAELEEDGSRMRIAIATLEGEKAALETKVASVEEEIKVTQAKVEDLEKATAEKDSQINTLNSEKDGLTSEVAVLTVAKDEKERELAAAREHSEVVVTILNDKIKSVESEKEAEVAAAKAAAEKSMAELQAKINAAEAAATKIQTELLELQSKTPEDYTAAVAKFGKEKDELSEKVNALQAEVNSKNAEADSRIAALAVEKAELEAKKALLEAETSMIPELRDQAAAQAAALADKISLAERQAAEARAAQEMAMAEIQRMSAQVTQLKAKISETSKARKEKKKAKSDFFFVRPSQDRGRMQVMKKNELKELRTSRSSSRNGADTASSP